MKTLTSRSGADRLAEQLGGEQHLRILLAAIADAIDSGEMVQLRIEPDPRTRRARSAPQLLTGGALW